MIDAITITELRRLPLFAALNDAGLELLLDGLSAQDVAQGQILIQQGRLPNGAWFLDNCEAEVVACIPGGGERLMATVGAGALVGDTALIDAGPPTATVRAITPGRALYLGRSWFHGLLGQGQPVALSVLRVVQHRLAERLRTLANELGTGTSPSADTVRPTKVASPAKPTMDIRPYLSLLPFFNDFAPDQVDTVMASGYAQDVRPGNALYDAGDTRDGIYIVVRGAMRILGHGDVGRLPQAVLGPGRAVGLLALVLGTNHGNTCITPEGATVLHLPEATSRQLYEGTGKLSQVFLKAVSRDLINILASMTNDLSRRTSQRMIKERGTLQASR